MVGSTDPNPRALVDSDDTEVAAESLRARHRELSLTPGDSIETGRH